MSGQQFVNKEVFLFFLFCFLVLHAVRDKHEQAQTCNGSCTANSHLYLDWTWGEVGKNEGEGRRERVIDRGRQWGR